ncbi:MAG: hypothetical protein AAI978_00515 [Candidatus Hodgkinia cicadicola]
MYCIKPSVALATLGLIVVNKPINMSSWCLLTLSKSSSFIGLCQLAQINRIDSLTSGLVALGVRQLKVGLLTKVYLCIVNSLTVRLRTRVSVWLMIKRRWKLCVSYFVWASIIGLFALTRAELVTGRKHQLRRQLLALSAAGARNHTRCWCLHSFKLCYCCFGCLGTVCASVL